MKSRVIRAIEEAYALESEVKRAAAATVQRIVQLSNEEEPLRVLEALKFEQSGRDPLDSSRPLNLIEQLNQTFTYLVSIRAVEYLFREHPQATPYRVNLGTAAGSDLESVDGTVAAEVFAATHPDSNRKLAKDIAKVAKSAARYRYVFFHCPGEYPVTDRDGVAVVPLPLQREGSR